MLIWRPAKNSATSCTMPGWSMDTTSTRYGTILVLTARASVYLTVVVRSSFLPMAGTWLSSLATALQLPETSIPSANSPPSTLIRLSSMLQPLSKMTLDTSLTMQGRSLPIAEMTSSFFMVELKESGCAASEGSGVYPQNPARNRHGGYFLSLPSSALRSAKGLLVAVAGLEVVKPNSAPAPRTRVEYFWCSQSWQYMQRFSQLLPSGGLLSWLWSLWCTVNSCRFSRVNSRPQRPQTCGCNLSDCSRY